mgnify:CR=1 FL=1
MTKILHETSFVGSTEKRGEENKVKNSVQGRIPRKPRIFLGFFVRPKFSNIWLILRRNVVKNAPKNPGLMRYISLTLQIYCVRGRFAVGPRSFSILFLRFIVLFVLSSDFAGSATFS